MPELPEVTTIQSQLRRKIVNKKIKEVLIKDKRIVKAISSKKFKAQVEGKTIKDILRRGKVLIIRLEESLFIIIHLRISGWLILSKEEERFSRIIFKLSNGELLNFCDQRVLGELRLVSDWQHLSVVKTMGPEPLDISKKEFLKLFEGKKTKIKPLLMDQRFIAGIGNIYAQEALFLAKIDPRRLANTLSLSEKSLLYEKIKYILKKAIENKGSSVDSYRVLDGTQGGMEEELKVYGREGELCCVCEKPLKKIALGGRGTCFCCHCQK
jgi:formamidopyrimidine-DNA glycosylase